MRTPLLSSVQTTWVLMLPSSPFTPLLSLASSVLSYISPPATAATMSNVVPSEVTPADLNKRISGPSVSGPAPPRLFTARCDALMKKGFVSHAFGTVVVVVGATVVVVVGAIVVVVVGSGVVVVGSGVVVVGSGVVVVGSGVVVVGSGVVVVGSGVVVVGSGVVVVGSGVVVVGSGVVVVGSGVVVVGGADVAGVQTSYFPENNMLRLHVSPISFVHSMPSVIPNELVDFKANVATRSERMTGK
jgi:hypothetical protein